MARILRSSLLVVCGCLVLLSNGTAQDVEKVRVTDPYRSGVPTSFSPYSAYPLDPLAARLAGVADLTRAAGTYHALVQEAAEKRQQVRAMKLKNREEELKYMRMRHDTLRDIHQEDIQRAIKDEEKR